MDKYVVVLFFLFFFEKITFSRKSPLLYCDIVVSICLQVGDLQTSFNAVKRSVDAFPQHTNSLDLLKVLEQHFAML